MFSAWHDLVGIFLPGDFERSCASNLTLKRGIQTFHNLYRSKWLNNNWWLCNTKKEIHNMNFILITSLLFVLFHCKSQTVHRPLTFRSMLQLSLPASLRASQKYTPLSLRSAPIISSRANELTKLILCLSSGLTSLPSLNQYVSISGVPVISHSKVTD